MYNMFHSNNNIFSQNNPSKHCYSKVISRVLEIPKIVWPLTQCSGISSHHHIDYTISFIKLIKILSSNSSNRSLTQWCSIRFTYLMTNRCAPLTSSRLPSVGHYLSMHPIPDGSYLQYTSMPTYNQTQHDPSRLTRMTTDFIVTALTSQHPNTIILIDNNYTDWQPTIFLLPIRFQSLNVWFITKQHWILL